MFTSKNMLWPCSSNESLCMNFDLAIQRPQRNHIYWPKVPTGHLGFIDFLQIPKQSYYSIYIPESADV